MPAAVLGAADAAWLSLGAQGRASQGKALSLTPSEPEAPTLRMSLPVPATAPCKFPHPIYEGGGGEATEIHISGFACLPVVLIELSGVPLLTLTGDPVDNK